MADILYASLKSEFDRKIGDSDEVTPERESDPVPDNVWRCVTFVTQDYDMLTEFIFKFRLRLDSEVYSNRLVYFDPEHYWAYIRIPKLKLKWGSPVSQTKIGVRTYSILSGTWNNGNFLPGVEAGTSCELVPSVPVPKEQQVGTVLVPHGNIISVVDDPDPGFKIPDLPSLNLKCKYAITYYNININRNGIYINRKYRDVQQLVPLSSIAGDYLVLEPKAYYLGGSMTPLTPLSSNVSSNDGGSVHKIMV